MSHSSKFCATMLIVATIVMAGCSNSTRTSSEALKQWTEPLVATNSALPVAFPEAGPPMPAPVVDLGTPASALPGAGLSNAGLADPNVLSELRGIALAVVSGSDGSSPTTMRAVAVSDHQAAAFAISGAIIRDRAPVYVITIKGGPFTAPHHPPGIAAPQGNVLTVTVDAATYRITDVGYNSAEADLDELASLPIDL